MAEQPFYNKKWGAADFERYHNGTMPERERHALEKATLEDPFLEEALEGYAITKTPLQDLAYLKNQLAGKKKFRLAWYKSNTAVQAFKVAAILVIFLGIAWLFKIKTSEQKPEIASVKNDLPVTIESKNEKDRTATQLQDTNVYAQGDSVQVLTQTVPGVQ